MIGISVMHSRDLNTNLNSRATSALLHFDKKCWRADLKVLILTWKAWQLRPPSHSMEVAWMPGAAPLKASLTLVVIGLNKDEDNIGMTIHPTPKMRYSSSCYSLSLAYNESSASHFFLTQRHQGWSLPGPQSLFRGPTLGESGAWWAVRRCPKFTFSTFTPDPNLHKSQIYTGPKFTQPRFTQIHFLDKFGYANMGLCKFGCV